MIKGGFLSESERQGLHALARSNLSEARTARRANAIILLDRGWSCEQVSAALLMDDDTVRSWYKLYQDQGRDGLVSFDFKGSLSRLSPEQEECVKAWVEETLPGSTPQIGAFIAEEFGLCYESRSGLIKLMHRLGFEYRKPEEIGRRLDESKQQAFIAAYEDLLNNLGADEVVLFADAVHPTHAARPVGCWVAHGAKPAIEQTSGRQRLNIHGAIDLETGQTQMVEAQAIDAASTIRLLEGIERNYRGNTAIHVFLDNARYHHAVLVQEWLAQSKSRIKLHFVPAYCPHLNPIERLWGLMHKHITHNKTYPTFRQFADEILFFLRNKVPKYWEKFRESVTDNFRVINPGQFRIIT